MTTKPKSSGLCQKCSSIGTFPPFLHGIYAGSIKTECQEHVLVLNIDISTLLKDVLLLIFKVLMNSVSFLLLCIFSITNPKLHLLLLKGEVVLEILAVRVEVMLGEVHPIVCIVNRLGD